LLPPVQSSDNDGNRLNYVGAGDWTADRFIADLIKRGEAARAASAPLSAAVFALGIETLIFRDKQYVSLLSH
jgi:hypothetical protein